MMKRVRTRDRLDEAALPRGPCGWVESRGGGRAAFYVTPENWTALLSHGMDVPDAIIPKWRAWSAAFAFLSAVIVWADESERQGWTEYVAASRARDLYDSHQRSLRVSRVDRKGLRAGEDGPTALRRVVEQIGKWL